MKETGKIFKATGMAGEIDAPTDCKAALFPNPAVLTGTPAALTATVESQTRTLAAVAATSTRLNRRHFSEELGACFSKFSCGAAGDNSPRCNRGLFVPKKFKPRQGRQKSGQRKFLSPHPGLYLLVHSYLRFHRELLSFAVPRLPFQILKTHIKTKNH